MTVTQWEGFPTTKILFNSTVSTPGARFCTFEIKDFYYGSPMEYCKYMRIQLSSIPQDVIDQYNLETIKHDGWVYINIKKIMPGLKQAGKIDNDHLWTHLEKYGYAPFWHTPDLWKNETRDIILILVVDDFGIKLTSSQDSEHLSSELEDLYVTTKDCEGTNVLGLTLNRYYTTKTVKITCPSMSSRPSTNYSTQTLWIPRTYTTNGKITYMEHPHSNLTQRTT